MIQEKHLSEFYPNLQVKGDFDLQNLSSSLKVLAETNLLPCTFAIESVKFGSMLRSHVDDCLCIFHPEHPKDYYTIILHIEKGTLSVYRFGVSKQMHKQMEKQQLKKSGGTFAKGLLGGHDAPDAVSGAFASVAGAGIMMKGTAGMLFHAVKSIGGSKSKLQEEQSWYDALYAAIRASCIAN